MRDVVMVTLVVSLMPLLAQAVEGDPRTDPAYAKGYVPCGYTDPTTRAIVNPCDFTDALELGRRIITGWIMAGVTIGTMGFAYAGYLYITAMGSEEKIKHAHSIFYKVIIGMVFMVSAWLIAKVFEDTFLAPEQQQRSFLKSS